MDGVRRGGPWFRVDPETGEPIIDLRELEKAGKLHLVKKIARRTSKRTIPGKEGGAPSIEEETKDVGVELHSRLVADELLGRFLGMDKTRPDAPSTLVDARTFVVAILESGDPKARAALEAIARKMYP